VSNELQKKIEFRTKDSPDKDIIEVIGEYKISSSILYTEQVNEEGINRYIKDMIVKTIQQQLQHDGCNIDCFIDDIKEEQRDIIVYGLELYRQELNFRRTRAIDKEINMKIKLIEQIIEDVIKW
jgi:hypothetical protein